jgi:outer membrane protein
VAAVSNSNPGPQLNPAQLKYGVPDNAPNQPPVDLDLNKPLTLDRAIEIGLQRHNSIAIALQQVKAAQAGLTQAKSSYYPQVAPTFQYQTQLAPNRGINVTTNPNGGTTPSSRYISSTSKTSIVAASLLLYDSGKREANVALSRHNLRAAEYSSGDQRQSLILLITQNYYDLLRNQALVRVERESLNRAQTTLEDIRAQVEVGAAAQSDTLQSESDLANAKVALLQAQNNLEISQANLKNAMGVMYTGNLALPDESLPLPSATTETTGLDDFVARAYAQRLDVKQQQERVYAQEKAVRIARINNGLSVDANVTEGYALQPVSGEDRSFNLSVSYPLFNGGLTRAAVRESQAQLEIEKRNLDQLEQNIRLDVEQAYVTREEARQQVQAAQTAVQAGQTNFNAAQEKQTYGLVDILEVINAEVQLVNAQVALVQAQYDYYIGDAQLRRAIGENDVYAAPPAGGTGAALKTGEFKPALALNAPERISPSESKRNQ